jgi:hypothetical protein
LLEHISVLVPRVTEVEEVGCDGGALSKRWSTYVLGKEVSLERLEIYKLVEQLNTECKLAQ